MLKAINTSLMLTTLTHRKISLSDRVDLGCENLALTFFSAEQRYGKVGVTYWCLSKIHHLPGILS